MAVSEELIIKLQVDSQGAVVGIRDVSGALKSYSTEAKKASQVNNTFKENFKSLAIALTGLNQGLELGKKAFNALAQPVMAATNAFVEAEGIQRTMVNTLAIMGDNVSKTSADIERFARNMEALTVIDDETATSLYTLGRATGATTERSKQLVQAAADLAAVTGKDVNDAFVELSGQLSGIPGRLAKFVPELKNLTETQLKAGVGIDLVAKKFKGFSQALATTLPGIIQQAKNSFGNLVEEIGRVISESTDLPAMARFAREAFDSMREKIEQLRPSIVALGMEVKQTVLAMNTAFRSVDFGPMIENFKTFAASLAIVFSPQIAAAIATFLVPLGLIAIKAALISTALVAAAAAIDIFFRNIGKAGQVAELFAGAFATAFAKVKESVLDLAMFILRKLGETVIALGKAFPSFQDQAVMAMGAISEATTSVADALIGAQEESKLFAEQLKRTSEGLDMGFTGDAIKKFKDLFDKFRKEMKKPVPAPTPGAALPAPAAPMASPDFVPKPLFDGEQMAQITGALGETAGTFASSLSSFASLPTAIIAAANMILDAILAIIDAIPQIIKKIGDVFLKLTQFPKALTDAVRSTMTNVVGFARNFLQNVGKEIVNIIDSLIQGLLIDLPDAVLSTVNQIPEILQKLLDRLPDLIRKLVVASIRSFITTTATGFVAILKANIPLIMFQIIKAVPEMVKALVEGIVEGLKQGFNLIKEMLKGNFNLFDGQQVESLGAKLQQSMTGVGDQMFRVLDLEADARGVSAAEKIQQTLDKGIMKFADIFRQLINGLKRVWQFIYDNYLVFWINILKATFMAVFDNLKVVWAGLVDIFKAAWEFVKVIWAGLMSVFSAVWENVKIIWAGLMSVLTTAWESIKTIFTSLWDGVKAIWQTLMDMFSGKINILDGVMKIGGVIFDTAAKAFGAVWDVAKSIFNAAVDAFKGAWNVLKSIFEAGANALSAAWNVLKAIFNAGAATLGSVWEGLKNIFNAGFNTLKGIFNNFSAMEPEFFKNFRNALHSEPEFFRNFRNALHTKPGWFQEVQDFFANLGNAASDTGKKAKSFFGLAEGGMVPLYAAGGTFVPRGTDTVPAMLTPGEFVVRRPVVDEMGQGFFERLNAGAGMAGQPSNNVKMDVTVNITTGDKLDDLTIKSRLIPAIKKELKAASLRGEFLLSDRAIR